MLPPDPLRILYRLYSLLNRFGRLVLSPLGLVTSLVFYVRKIFRKNVRLDNIGDWRPIRTVRHKFYWLASRPKKLLKSNLFRSAKKTYPFRAVKRLIRLGFKTSFVEPMRWLIQLAGFTYSWASSRKWIAIALTGLPAMLIPLTIFLDFRASRINKKDLTQRYLEWAEAEQGTIERSFDLSEVIKSRLGESEAYQQDYSRDHRLGFSRAHSNNKQVTGYGDLLYRRVQQLSPGEHSSFVVGLKLLEKGATVAAQKVLSKIAPDDSVQDFRAHGVMASILLEQIAVTADESLFPVFQHHAAAGSRWRFIPPEVLSASAELHWIAGEQERAFELLNIAAEMRPEFFLLYHERAMEAGFLPLAESIRGRAITRFQRLLKQDARNNMARANLATLHSASPDGIETAEELLKEGMQINPDKALSRALSELYLKQVKSLAEKSLHDPEIPRLLDKALAIDASNPNIADLIASLMQRLTESSTQTQFVALLNGELVTGKATTSTHAMLAEYYLQNNQRKQAIIHLEQVVRIAPTAAKFANYLAYEYARNSRFQDAFNVANRSLSLLSQKQLLGEMYVEDLLDTLGKLYHKQENWPETIPIYELCLKLNPERSDTRLRLAKVYRKSGRNEEAMEQELLAKKSEAMASRRKTLVQKLASPEMRLNQTLGIGSKRMDESISNVTSDSPADSVEDQKGAKNQTQAAQGRL